MAAAAAAAGGMSSMPTNKPISRKPLPAKPALLRAHNDQGASTRITGRLSPPSDPTTTSPSALGTLTPPRHDVDERDHNAQNKIKQAGHGLQPLITPNPALGAVGGGPLRRHHLPKPVLAAPASVADGNNGARGIGLSQSSSPLSEASSSGSLSPASMEGSVPNPGHNQHHPHPNAADREIETNSSSGTTAMAAVKPPRPKIFRRVPHLPDRSSQQQLGEPLQQTSGAGHSSHPTTTAASSSFSSAASSSSPLTGPVPSASPGPINGAAAAGGKKSTAELLISSSTSAEFKGFIRAQYRKMQKEVEDGDMGVPLVATPSKRETKTATAAARAEEPKAGSSGMVAGDHPSLLGHTPPNQKNAAGLSPTRGIDGGGGTPEIRHVRKCDCPRHSPAALQRQMELEEQQRLRLLQQQWHDLAVIENGGREKVDPNMKSSAALATSLAKVKHMRGGTESRPCSAAPPSHGEDTAIGNGAPGLSPASMQPVPPLSTDSPAVTPVKAALPVASCCFSSGAGAGGHTKEEEEQEAAVEKSPSPPSPMTARSAPVRKEAVVVPLAQSESDSDDMTDDMTSSSGGLMGTKAAASPSPATGRAEEDDALSLGVGGPGVAAPSLMAAVSRAAAPSSSGASNLAFSSSPASASAESGGFLFTISPLPQTIISTTTTETTTTTVNSPEKQRLSPTRAGIEGRVPRAVSGDAPPSRSSGSDDNAGVTAAHGPTAITTTTTGTGPRTQQQQRQRMARPSSSLMTSCHPMRRASMVDGSGSSGGGTGVDGSREDQECCQCCPCRRPAALMAQMGIGAGSPAEDEEDRFGAPRASQRHPIRRRARLPVSGSTGTVVGVTEMSDVIVEELDMLTAYPPPLSQKAMPYKTADLAVTNETASVPRTMSFLGACAAKTHASGVDDEDDDIMVSVNDFRRHSVSKSE